jgi:hypothetical protein
MGTHVRLIALVLLAAALAACQRPAEVPAAEAEQAQASAADSIVPAIVAVRDAIEPALPAPPPPPSATVDPRATALIVQFEIRSPSYYAAHLQSPVWPGAQSGVTWGIGYDGGQQTRARIASDWHMHAQVERLVATSGVVGVDAGELARSMRDVRTPFDLAERVFTGSTLPAYRALAARAYRRGWDELSPVAQGALVATVYNRGAGMAGDRRREMRTLRDECVPRHDYACMAAQFRSMTRLWRGTTIEVGMRERYEATARLVEQHAET